MKHISQFIEKQLLAIAALLLWAGCLQAQNPFPTGGFNLPNGKTIVVAYEVTVNTDACPTSTVPNSNIANQSQVQGSNFATVLTDDPDVAGASNPTTTLFSSLTLGNLVYNDLNRDGDYDAGTDAGLNGVLVNLYLDNGDNTLTGADGAPITSTTTAGGGFYSFAVCPGSYIVEVAASNFASGGALYNAGAPYVSSPLTTPADPDLDAADNDDNGNPVSGFGVATAAITLAYGTEPDGADLNTNNRVDLGFKTPTTVTIGDRTLAEGTGGGSTAFNFTVTRSDADQAFSLTVNTAGGTATSGTDFTAISGGMVSFTAGGSLMATVTVNVTRDNIVEANETFTVNLSGAPSGVIITDGTGDGMINNDDNATLTLSTGVAESESTLNHQAYIGLSAPVQGGFTIAYSTMDATATVADNDYNGVSTTLNFAGNVETKTITIVVKHDTKVELDETYNVVLGAITNTTAVQMNAISFSGSPQPITIQNDDAATVRINDNVSQGENITPQTFTIILSNPVDVPVTVLFNTTDGAATTSDNDYTGIVDQLVTFNAGTTTNQLVNVTINNDTKVEANEVFNVGLSGLSASGRNVSLGTSTGTGTITNDDFATVTLTGGSSANEGNSGTTSRVFTATLNNPVQGGFTLDYATNDGTATTANSDYVDNDGPALSFAGTANETKTITVLVNGDPDIEADETFTVTLGAFSNTTLTSLLSVVGSPQTATILNDEVDWGDVFDIGAPFFSTTLSNNGARHKTVVGLHLGATIDGDPDGQSSFTASGDDTDADGDDEDGVVFPSALIKGTTANIAVTASAPGFLDAWLDFEANASWDDPGNQIFTSFPLMTGVNSLSFAVPVAASSTSNAFARFRFSSTGALSNTGLANDGEVEDYMVSITDNFYSISSPTITEGSAPNTVTLSFIISRTNSSSAGSVDYAITGGTATAGSDYASIPGGTINFSAGGNPSETISITVNGDAIVENNETIIITLSNPVGAGIGTETGTGTITNDDSATLTLTGGGPMNEGLGGTGFFTFTATLSAAVQGGFQVPFTTGNGTATPNVDYNDNDGTFTFTGNVGETKTWAVFVNGDLTVELDETFEAALGTLTGSSVVQLAAISKSGSPRTATLVNDDSAVISIDGANYNQSEGISPLPVLIRLSNPVDVSVSVNFSTFDGTATIADNDYGSIQNQTVTFPPNSTDLQYVYIPIINDTKVEADETLGQMINALVTNGRNVTLANASRTVDILNDDIAVLTMTIGFLQPEGNAGTTAYNVNVTLNNRSVPGGFTLPYNTNDLTATLADNDYQDNDGTLLFAGTIGEVKTFTVLVNGDLNIENNETFQVALGSIGATPNPAAIVITDSPQPFTIENDELEWGDAPTAAQSGFASSYPTTQANNGAAHIAVPGGLRLGASLDADLNGQPNATATGDGADEDGVILPGALVLSTTANVTVNASGSGFINAWVDWNRDGDWIDPSEKVLTSAAVVSGNNTLSFAVPANASTGTSFARSRLTAGMGSSSDGIAVTGEVEDYQVNIVNTQFAVNDTSTVEGNLGTSALSFTVSRTTNANACSVDYTITDGSATTSDADYQPLAAGTVNFAVGGPLTQNVTVLVNGDLKVELNETVEITLSNPVNGSILDGTGTGTIFNDDQAVLTVSSPTVTEGDAGSVNATFNLNLSNPVDVGVTINHVTNDGSATTANSDYQTTNGSLTFNAGQTTATVNVPVLGDCAIEPNETFVLRLGSLSTNGRNVVFSGGGALLDGTGTITNDDALPVLTCPADLSLNTDQNLCSATLALPLPTVGSICGGSTLEFRYRTVDAANQPTGAFNNYAPAASNTVAFAPGRYEMEWRVTDGSGSSLCSHYVQVTDAQLPTVVCPPDLVKSSEYDACGTDAVVLGTATTSDNCGVADLSNDAPGFYNVGTTSVTWVVTDVTGNTNTCVQVVTVNDNILPVVQCPDNLTITSSTFDCSAEVNYSVALFDNCGLASVEYSQESGTVFPGGSTLVTVTAFDPTGNSVECAFWVFVQAAPEVCDNVDNDCDGLVDEADDFVQVEKLFDSPSGQFDQFGNAVAIDGHTALAGVQLDDEKGFNAGAAQIFERDADGNWLPTKRLLANDGATDDQFGHAVALAGNYALVSAHLRDDNGINVGAVYVFERNQGGANQWGQVTKLLPDDATSNQNFGGSLAFDGRFALVGSSLDDQQANNAGAAYLFDGLTNWAPAGKLTAADGQDNDDFGSSVAVDGDWAVVGAPQHDALGDQAGAAYLFRRDANTGIWSQFKKLVAQNTVAGDRLGFAVALSGDYAVLGAPRNDFRTPNGGSGYVFERNQGGGNQWNEASKLFAYDSEAGDQLGRSVSVDGPLAVVGTPYEDAKGSGAGAAYVFFRQTDGGWIFLKKIVDPTGNLDDNLFTALALSGQILVAGAPRDDDNTTIDRGTVQWFEAQCADPLSPFAPQVPGSGGAVGVAIKNGVSLEASPVPFSQVLNVRFTLPEVSEQVAVEVLNPLGQVIATLHQGALGKGVHNLQWQPTEGTAPGAYFLQLTTTTTHEVRPVVYGRE